MNKKQKPTAIVPNQNFGSVLIAGIGACTPVGACAVSSAAAVRAGISSYREHPYLTNVAGGPIYVAMAPSLSANDKGIERYCRILQAPMEEALSPLQGLDKLPLIPVILGLPAQRLGLPERLEEQIKNKVTQATFGSCQIAEVSIIAKGHSAGLMALERGLNVIQSSGHDFCLIGGVDSYLEPETLNWLENTGQLHRAGESENPLGFVPGEAAGFCLLASKKAVDKYKLKTFGSVLSIALTHEKNLINTDAVCIGQGLSEAFANALQAIPPEVKIDHIICDLNGEPYRADEYGFTLARFSDRFAASGNFLAPAKSWGDVGAASGPLFLNLTIAAGENGYAKGPHTLLFAGSESGERLATAVHVPVREHFISAKGYNATRVIPDIVTQYAEEAAFRWHLRDNAVCAPHYSLDELAELDNRVEANLDGLRIAGQTGWDLCVKTLAQGDAGECFVAAVLAFESKDESRIQIVLDKGSGVYKLSRGIVSALGWLPYEKTEPHIRTFISSQFPEYRRIGMAASAIHRKDPGDSLVNALSDNDPLLRARALKAAGELGNTKLLPSVQASLTHADEGCRFWAAWSLAMLGDANSLPILKTLAVSSKQYQEESVKAALRRMSAKDALLWQGEFALRPETMRQAVIGSGVIGNHTMIPWVIEQMKSPALSRIAGEAFSMITGIDIALEHLDAKKPEGFESGPNDDPKDSNVEMDADDDLPWPNGEAVKAWWEKQKGAYKNGTRYFMGKPIAKEHLQNVLKSGYQHQRRAAAMELAFLNPGQPLFETRAPGWRQK